MTEDQIRDVANILVVTIVGLLSYFGFIKGRGARRAEPEQEVMELKGAVISDKKADEIISSIEDFSRHVVSLRHLLEDLQAAIRSASLDSKDEFRELQRDIRDLVRELKNIR